MTGEFPQWSGMVFLCQAILEEQEKRKQVEMTMKDC